MVSLNNNPGQKGNEHSRPKGRILVSLVSTVQRLSHLRVFLVQTEVTNCNNSTSCALTVYAMAKRVYSGGVNLELFKLNFTISLYFLKMENREHQLSNVSIALVVT